MKKIKWLTVLVCCLLSPLGFAKFNVIALGTGGGVYVNNITSYLVRDSYDEKFLALDAGSMSTGINLAIKKGHFSTITDEVAAPYTVSEFIFRKRIAGYFISHAHLDHVAELVVHSTNDDKKPIYGLQSTNEALKKHYFNWVVWPNMLDVGIAPTLNLYQLVTVSPDNWFSIQHTELKGKVFPLSHSGVVSSMLLIRNRHNEYVAFFGDTGADRIEQSTSLATIWSELAPLVREKQLKGIIIESSFSNEIPDNLLFGHLTPYLLLEELSHLEVATGIKGSLTDLNVIISHIKPSDKQMINREKLIEMQLNKENTLGVKFHLLKQGDELTLL